jgi:membrane protein YdbS with pleckstrin-like domain
MATLTTIEQYPLEKRKITKKIVSVMFNCFIFFGIILAFTAFIGGLNLIIVESFVGLYILIFLFELWYQPQYFKLYFYNIEADFLVIKKGVITPAQTTLPYEKLQDVYMDQDIFDRLFNLWDVHVSTATTQSGIQAHIDGVSIENAEALRKIILEKTKKTR